MKNKPLLKVWVVGTRFKVKGEKRLESTLETFKVGEKVELVREPKNKHDPNAIKVIFKKKHIGYLSRDDARELKRIDLLKYQFFFFDFRAVASGLKGISTTEIIGIPHVESNFDFFKRIVCFEMVSCKFFQKRSKYSSLYHGYKFDIEFTSAGLIGHTDRIDFLSVSPLVQSYFAGKNLSEMKFFIYGTKQSKNDAPITLRVIARV